MASFTLGVILIALHVAVCVGDYRGAVVEYPRVWNSSAGPEQDATQIMTNVGRYVDIIGVAKLNNVDIIVFPEMGLMPGATTSYIPVPETEAAVTPWKDNIQHQALRELSKAAFANRMYVVVNLLEIDHSPQGTDIIYNTDVAFDRNGTIVAKYRKFNLYGENLGKPELPDYVYFDTDFGARFGLFTCFDILFEEPALTLVTSYNVTDVAFPSAWYSELPFLSSVQYQSAWSYGTGVNMLASGLNDVSQGSSGSGIYSGAGGPLQYILSQRDGCKIIYQDLTSPSGRNDAGAVPVKSEGGEWEGGVCRMTDSGKLNHLKDDLTIYRKVPIIPPQGDTRVFHVEEDICQRDLCCSFRIRVEMRKRGRPGTYEYMMAVFDGVRDFHGQGTGGSQVCGIVACLEGELCRRDGDMALAEVTIAGSFQGERSFIAPNIFLASHSAHRFGQLPTPPTFNFVKSPKPNGKVSASLQFGFNASLISASIYSRVFDRDGQPPSTAGSSTGTWSFLLCVAISLVFLLRSSRSH